MIQNTNTSRSSNANRFDFSSLSISARIEIYEDMLIDGLEPDLELIMQGVDEHDQQIIISDLMLSQFLFIGGQFGMTA